MVQGVWVADQRLPGSRTFINTIYDDKNDDDHHNDDANDDDDDKDDIFIELCIMGSHKIQLQEYPIPAASASHPDSLFTMKKNLFWMSRNHIQWKKSRKSVFKKFTT